MAQKLKSVINSNGQKGRICKEIKGIFKKHGLSIVDIEQTSKNHLKITFNNKNGVRGIVYNGLTPSDTRAYKNLVRQAKRSLHEEIQREELRAD